MTHVAARRFRVARTVTSLTLAAAAAAAAAAGCAVSPAAADEPMLSGPLISARTTMVTAWIVPQNPLEDATLDGTELGAQIRRGYRIFGNTPAEAPRFTPSRMSCSNCHLNAGQRERAMPLVNIAGLFPEYNRRTGRLFNLVDRIIECFWRSENAAGGGAVLPTNTDEEVLALSAYITWLSRGAPVGERPSWRGQNVIAREKLIPVERLDPAVGEAIYTERCTTCHGTDGQGVEVGDKKPGPLWGPHSWSDGAGAARIYTLAGFIRYAMPYLAPGSLTDEEAQQVAAYITSQPRPSYPFKDRDYRTEKLPQDAVYYTRLLQQP